jgi:predicted nuclease of predicted toxin-antitoxin system
VKLLLDENLSDRIISRVADLFPDATHIKAVGLREADDFVVWEWAKKHGLRLYQRTQIFIKGLLYLATRRSSYGYVLGIARLA